MTYDDRLAHGRSYFSREEALKALDVASRNFAAAVTKLINKGRLANPRHGFFLILRPEYKVIGAPDPARWIDPLMKHQRLEYRISLLRAAAFQYKDYVLVGNDCWADWEWWDKVTRSKRCADGKLANAGRSLVRCHVCSTRSSDENAVDVRHSQAQLALRPAG